jgi:hypothetical protein
MLCRLGLCSASKSIQLLLWRTRGDHAVWGGGAQGGGDRGSWLGRRGSGEMAGRRSAGSRRMEDRGSDVILFDSHVVGRFLKRSFILIWRE